jgi:hypothetical protein
MKEFKFFSFMALFAIVALSSCQDVVVSTPVSIDLLPKAHIVGRVSAELNLQTAGFEVVPTGTKLLVEINYSNINSDATSGKWTDTVTVADDGKYDIAVPADANGVTVSISPFTFEADQVQPYGAFYKTITKSYTFTSLAVSINSGQTKTQDIIYVASTLASFVDKVSISGKCLANLSSETPGLESVPNGTVLNFYTSDWKDSAIVSNGSYSLVVPNKTVTFKIQFVYAKRVWVTNSDYTLSGYQNINYKYSLTGSATPSSSTNTLDISLGEGTDLTVDPTPNTTVLSGLAFADLDATVAGLELVPDGTKIYFTSNTGDWGAVATVSGGKYSITIPRYTSFSSPASVLYNISFNANKKSSSGTLIYNFIASGSTSTTSSATKSFNITAY